MNQLTKYKLESENAQNMDYRRIRRERALVNLQNAIENGWQTPNKEHRSLLKEQKKVVTDYLSDQLANTKIKSGFSVTTTLRYILLMSVEIKKPYSQYTEKDIKNYLSKMKLSGKKPNTMCIISGKIKAFFTWYYKDDKTIEKDDGIPHLVSWIKAKTRSKILHHSELLNYEEIYAMVNVATNERDEFTPISLYESGGRAEEFTEIKLGHVSLKRIGKDEVLYIDVDGKTGKRQVFCKHAVPYYKKYIEKHPYKNNPNAPLLVSTIGANPAQMSPLLLAHTIKKLAKTAGIKKNVYPHLFRHSRATELAQYMTEPELRIYFGWQRDSAMPSNYVHMCNKNVQNKLNKVYGLKSDEELEIKDSLFKLQKCKCGHKNSPTQVYCAECGNDLKKSISEKKITDAHDVLNFGLNNPETKDKLTSLLTEIVKNMKGEKNEKKTDTNTPCT
ncbi:tyrosine-type recombinase/integrase [Candidatus Woesearchaeota archaeon]|nr:tyrosine-type recombinase/integrase [Candidatus Woesearchaeota archaeon]